MPRFHRGSQPPSSFSLGNALVVAGSRPSGDGNASAFTRLDAGVEAFRPVEWSIADRRARLGTFYVASFFANNAEVLRLDAGRDETGMVHTFGLALGVETPLRFLGLEIDWAGLSYVSGQGLRGVQLNTGFPF